MERAIYSFDTLIGLLMVSALGLAAFSDAELETARSLLIAAAGLVCFRWIMWSFITQHDWWIRALIGASVGGFLLGALPPLFDWTLRTAGLAGAKAEHVLANNVERGSEE